MLAKLSAVLGGGVLLGRRVARLHPRQAATYGLAGLMAGSVTLALVYIAMGLVKGSRPEEPDKDDETLGAAE